MLVLFYKNNTNIILSYFIKQHGFSKKYVIGRTLHYVILMFIRP